MSKQSTANSIYENGIVIDASRKQTIAKIVRDLGVSQGYASTLYNNARKATQTTNDLERLGLVPSPSAPIPTAEKINQFDKANLRMIRAELNKALEETLSKFGLSAKVGSMSYKAHEFTTRLTISTGSQDDAAERNFKDNCRAFGLTPDDFGRQFKANGKTFTITGIKQQRRKYPITATSARGASYKFTESQVVRGLI